MIRQVRESSGLGDMGKQVVGTGEERRTIQLVTRSCAHAHIRQGGLERDRGKDEG